MPVVSVSDSFWVKVAWIENFAEPADNLARAESTLVSEVWIVLIKAEALVWVEIEAGGLDRHDRAATGSCSGPWVVTWRVPSDEASAVIWLVEPLTRLKPLKTGVLDDRGDLAAAEP